MKKIEKRKIMDEIDIKNTLERLASEILERHKDYKKIALIGIRTRGAPLAKRIKEILDKKLSASLPLGVLDITFYRDDLQKISESPEVKSTLLDFDVDGKEIILIDDVLYTGRTIRSALDAIIDFGRPDKVELLVLIDRGHRELPIHPDYLGKKVATSKDETVEVRLREIDGIDEVVICEIKK
ncbi:MAG: bifunctional pyr operon transcriptional regulator/uracil phosphoribosyltransferase PyrR [candidate division WOR-3 bacterium]|uniref:Bifunctional protein PyrR n=1 Tax=candidate division WOR-3 bacterium TaxID=2052148 RepID=A0A7V4ED67_UNCW3